MKEEISGASGKELALAINPWPISELEETVVGGNVLIIS